MREILFTPDMGLDGWSLFHLTFGIVVGFVVQHANYEKILELHEYMTGQFIKALQPHLKKMPKKIRKHIDLKKVTQPLWHAFDIHTVLMVAYAWEAFEMYLEQGQIIPLFSQLVQGQEHWVNRLILDPLMLVIGYRIARNFPKLFWPSCIATIGVFAWLVL